MLELAELGFIDNSFVSCNTTLVFANTKQNNPKSFASNRFKKDNLPKSDPDCKLGVHTPSNSIMKKSINYKDIVLTDAISRLPIAEITTIADVAESFDSFKDIHSFIRRDLNSRASIPFVLRNTKKKDVK